MRLTEFWRRMDDVFGPTYSRSWAADYALADLSGQTVNQALAAGVAAKDVWRAVCAHVDVPTHLV